MTCGASTAFTTSPPSPGPAQENLDFYSGVLGMRLVKKSVNQDDPGTYHLFYADAEGHPGTDLTFFPWAQMAPPRLGHGLAVEVGLEVPADSLEFWGARLEKYGATAERDRDALRRTRAAARRSARLRVALVEPATARRRRSFTPWDHSTVPPEHQVRGLYSAQLWERDARADGASSSPTSSASSSSAKRTAGRATASTTPPASSTCATRPTRGAARWGVGSVHHLAWRVDDEAHQLAVREQVEAAGGGRRR